MVVATAALIACVARSGSIRLASIHQLETREIIAGEEFKIFGDGFVPGEVEILLDGRYLAPGSAPRDMTLSFPGNAVTEREISTVLPLDAFKRLGVPHALFEGSVLARFEASSRVRMGYVEAVRNRVSLDILSNEPDGGRSVSELGERTRRFLELVGVQGQSDPEGGFFLTSLDEEKTGASVDLAVGDLVLVSRGLRVYSELDLLPAPGEAEITWVVARRDEAGEPRLHTITMDVPMQARDSGPDPVWLISGALALALALLSGDVLALLLLPFTTLRRWTSGLVARLRRRRDRIVSIPGESTAPPPPPARWVQNLLSLPVVLVAASGCAALVMTAGEVVHVAGVYVALVVMAWLTGFRESRPAHRTLASRTRRVLASLLAPAPVALIFVWRGLFTLRSSLDAMASGQGLKPWTWHGFSDPFAFVMLVMAIASSSLVERRDVGLARHAAHQLYTVVSCAVVVHVMLGGLAPVTLFSQMGPSQAMGVGLVLWVAKVLGLYLVTQARLGERPNRKVSDLWIVLGRPALLTGALVGSVMLGPAMGQWLPSLPHLTATLGAALVLASSTTRARQTEAIRIRPW